jgi:transcriptional regulator with XRE-family HTH domain
MGMYDAKQFGQRVLLSRRDLGWDQGQLSELSGVSRSRLSEIERGKGINIGIDSVFGIAEAMGVTVGYLLGLEEAPLSEPDADVLREQRGEYIAVDVESREQRRVFQQVVDLFAGLSPDAQVHALRYLWTVRKMDEDRRRPAPAMDEVEVEMWTNLLGKMDKPTQRTIKRSVGIDPDAPSA